MPPATEQPRKRKRGDQAPKIRFLNMSPEQIRRRYKRVKQRQYRKAQQRIKRRRPPSRADSSPTVRSGLKRKNAVRKGRPCCGLRVQNCKCKAPPGMRKSHLNALARRFGRTALSSFRDTTDVSTFQRLMAKRKRSKTLPLGVLLAYAHTHTLCSIKTTYCATSLRGRRSYSRSRGLIGNCYRALSRSLSNQVNDFARRISEAQVFEKYCYRVTSAKRVCYRAATILLSGPSWHANSWARMPCLPLALHFTTIIQAGTFGKHQC